MQKFVNLTRHPVVFVTPEGKTVSIRPSGQIARIQSELYEITKVQGVPIVYRGDHRVTGLPDPDPTKVLLVSGLVFNFLPERLDLGCPAQMVRHALDGIRSARCLEVHIDEGEPQ